MDAIYKEERPPNPRSKANIFEILTYSWILKLIKRGMKKEINLTDLYNNLEDDSSESLGNKLYNLWNDELVNAKENKKKPSFLKTLCRMFGTNIILWTFGILLVDIVISIGMSTIVGKIVTNFDTKTSDDQKASRKYSAFVLIILMLIKAFFFNIFAVTISHFGMKMRVASCNLIYNKALRLKKNLLDQTSTGQIINLISNDVNRFDSSTIFLPYMIVGPLQTIVILYFLWQEVGVSSVLGVASLVIFTPLQVWLGTKTSEIRLKTAKRTDERVHLMDEIISGLQVIKMYTWESIFNKLMKYARKNETNKIIKSSCIKGILMSFFLFNTRIAIFVNLFAYVMLGNYITASKVFVVISYYNILRVTMTALFSPGIGHVSELLVSIKRIENFLLQEEKKSFPTTCIPQHGINKNFKNSNIVVSDKNCLEQSSDFSIVISNATAKWTDTQTDNSLENVNLIVRSGRLVAIIGHVGAGKSSLVQAILGELPLTKGNISVHGVVSYASQDPWLFSGSVRQNIIFGLPMDKERYKKVIKVCALKTDLKQFPYYDKTIVGEKGVSLSGGQRSRINLARAIYKQADIYLLDDPLSAVDTCVDFLKEKTCILITHQIQYLMTVDEIVTMENGIVIKSSYHDLWNSSSEVKKLIESSIETCDNKDETEKTCINNLVKLPIYTRQESILSDNSSIDDAKVIIKPVETAETHLSGNVSFGVYLSYFLAGGNLCKLLAFLLICILTQGLTSAGDYWITYWVNLEEHVYVTIDPLTPSENSTYSKVDYLEIPLIISRQTCVIIFTVLTCLTIVCALAQTFLFMSVCTTASVNLHNRMFSSILRATMNFLNKTPLGRILNRFSKDIGLIDETLPPILVNVIQMGMTIIGIFIVICIVNPYLIPPTVIVVMIFLKTRTIYMTTTRNVKRLEGVTRSPIYTHVNTSLDGITTIRAFKIEQILSKEFASHQDLHTSTWYLFIFLSRAFGFWLDIVCVIYVSVVVIFFILIGNDTLGGNVGLAITQSFVLTCLLQWSVRQSAELENYMTSVERVLEYTNVPQEAALKSTPDKKPPKEWPSKGKIIFKEFFLRYDLDTQFVLNNLSVIIEPMEKVKVLYHNIICVYYQP